MWRAGVESRGACLLGERHSCTNDEVKQTKTKKRSHYAFSIIFLSLPRAPRPSGISIRRCVFFLSAAKLGPFAFLICWGKGLAA